MRLSTKGRRVEIAASDCEVMPMERIANYLRYDAGSALALVDAIICAADTIGVISWHSGIESINFNFPLEKALWLS